jgi:uncharacterized membrane protein YhaH (DUF805 family)
MGAAFRRSLKHYGDFSGRSRRSEYWWTTLANALLIIPVTILLGIGVWLVTQGSEEAAGILALILYAVFMAAWAIPFGLALTVRRLHDIGKSGWWLLWMVLLGLIPFAGIIAAIFILVWYCTDSEVGDNRFGPNPKASIDSMPGESSPA